MKLATPSELKKLTGQVDPAGQYEVLTRELGLRPIFVDGRVRIYVEAIKDAMVSGTKQIKPKLNPF